MTQKAAVHLNLTPSGQAPLKLMSPGVPADDREPEQLLLIRMLQVVESIHTGQQTLAEDLRDIKANLPLQRRPLSRKAQTLHIRVIAARRNGLCPCCQNTPVCTECERLPGAEFDHWYGRNQNRVTQTWLVCGECNQRLLDADFKADARSSFEAYQHALRPFLGGRQIALGFGA